MGFPRIVASTAACLWILVAACAHSPRDEVKQTLTQEEIQARRDAAEAERQKAERQWIEEDRRHKKQLEEEAARRREEEVKKQETVATWTQVFPICEGKNVESGEFYECCISQLYGLREPLKLRLQTAQTEAERAQVLDAYTTVSALLAEYERTNAQEARHAQQAQREAEQAQREAEQRRAESFAQAQQARAQEEARRLMLLQLLLQRQQQQQPWYPTR